MQTTERNWTQSELKNLASNWSLAADSGLRSFLENSWNETKNKSLELRNDLETMLIKCQDAQILTENAMNSLSMISNDQFLENIIAEPNNHQTKTITADLTNNLEDQDEATIIPKISHALNLGLKIIDTFYTRLEVISAESRVSFDQPESVFIYQPVDIYEDRHLPHLIGSPSFFTDDTLGIGFINDTQSCEDPLDQLEAVPTDSYLNESNNQTGNLDNIPDNEHNEENRGNYRDDESLESEPLFIPTSQAGFNQELESSVKSARSLFQADQERRVISHDPLKEELEKKFGIRTFEESKQDSKINVSFNEIRNDPSNRLTNEEEEDNDDEEEQLFSNNKFLFKPTFSSNLNENVTSSSNIKTSNPLMEDDEEDDIFGGGNSSKQTHFIPNQKPIKIQPMEEINPQSEDKSILENKSQPENTVEKKSFKSKSANDYEEEEDDEGDLFNFSSRLVQPVSAQTKSLVDQKSSSTGGVASNSATKPSTFLTFGDEDEDEDEDNFLFGLTPANKLINSQFKSSLHLMPNPTNSIQPKESLVPLTESKESIVNSFPPKELLGTENKSTGNLISKSTSKEQFSTARQSGEHSEIENLSNKSSVIEIQSRNNLGTANVPKENVIIAISPDKNILAVENPLVFDDSEANGIRKDNFIPPSEPKLIIPPLTLDDFEFEDDLMFGFVETKDKNSNELSRQESVLPHATPETSATKILFPSTDFKNELNVRLKGSIINKEPVISTPEPTIHSTDTTFGVNNFLDTDLSEIFTAIGKTIPRSTVDSIEAGEHILESSASLAKARIRHPNKRKPSALKLFGDNEKTILTGEHFPEKSTNQIASFSSEQQAVISDQSKQEHSLVEDIFAPRTSELKPAAPKEKEICEKPAKQQPELKVVLNEEDDDEDLFAIKPAVIKPLVKIRTGEQHSSGSGLQSTGNMELDEDDDLFAVKKVSGASTRPKLVDPLDIFSDLPAAGGGLKRPNESRHSSSRKSGVSSKTLPPPLNPDEIDDLFLPTGLTPSLK